MRRVRVTYEAIVAEEFIKSNDDVIAEGFEDLEDAILTDGLDGVIEGSYSYTTSWEISDYNEGE